MINSFLDKLVCPEVHLLYRSWSTFQLFGLTGLLLAILLTTILVKLQNLSIMMTLLMIFSATSTGLMLALIMKMLTGEEKLVCYHQKIAIVAAVFLTLWLLGQPVLPYLDIAILGMGMYLACIRIGCFMVGCCHGRLHNWGVSYREEHADSGLPASLVGVRLFPIQLVESLWCLIIVSVGTVLVATGRTPGEALSWYVVTYCGGRFFLEFMRGDHDHHYFLGFSEPQWTSLVLILVIGVAEWSGVLILHPWHMGVAALIPLTMIVIMLKRQLQRNDEYKLLHPRHVREVAAVINQTSGLSAESKPSGQDFFSDTITLSSTSLGIQISVGQTRKATCYIYHYGLSKQDGMMTAESAKMLSGLILRLKHPSGWSEVIEGNRGVFHLLVHHPQRTDCCF